MILYRTLKKLRCLQFVFVQYQDDEVVMSLTDKTSFELSTNDFTAVVIYKKDCNHRIFFSVLYNIYINLHCINECCLRIDIEGKTDSSA
jgi:hypothetical protein